MTQRYTFSSLPPEYADMNRWRRVDISHLSDEEQNRYRNLRKGIETYVSTGKLKVASKESGYSEDFIIKQLNRCLTVANDGQLWGWAGLLKGERVKEYTRRSPLPTGLKGEVKGFSGSFSKFLEEHDDIRKELNTRILKQGGKNVVHEARITISKLTKVFEELCRSHGVKENQYPLNVLSSAKRSISRYVNWLIEQNEAKGTKARHGEAAAKYLRVATGDSSIPLFMAPYDVCGLDAHEIHCIGCIIVPGPAGPQRIAIERLWVILNGEYFSSSILGYSVGIRTEASSATVDEALISSTTEWKPRQLSIPGLKYLTGGGLPSGVIQKLAGCFPSILIVDNAAPHYAKLIAEHARKRIGCSITWGAIGHWEHNAVIERLFKTLETYGFQRLPSATGSNVMDPIKDNPVVKATQIGITYEALLDILDVLVANYNITPSRGLGGQSPLQVLRNNLELVEPTFLPRKLPPATKDYPDLGIVVETRFVRGNQKQGRRPYIEIDRVRYTSDVLSRSFGLVGNKLIIHIKEKDMRNVEAFFESGQELGSLRAQGRWGRTPHTREMRKQIMALSDAGELAFSQADDPVDVLLKYYSSKAYRDSLKRPKSVSRTATKLANAVNVSGHPVPPADSKSSNFINRDTDLNPSRPIPSTIKSPNWKSVT